MKYSSDSVVDGTYSVVNVVFWTTMRTAIRIVMFTKTAAALTQVSTCVDVETVRPWLKTVDGSIDDTFLIQLSETDHTSHSTSSEPYRVSKNSHS